jgi:hypothetical protein
MRLTSWCSRHPWECLGTEIGGVCLEGVCIWAGDEVDRTMGHEKKNSVCVGIVRVDSEVIDSAAGHHEA